MALVVVVDYGMGNLRSVEKALAYVGTSDDVKVSGDPNDIEKADKVVFPGQGAMPDVANRGEYVDIAAPGVNIRHARAGGGFIASSGTSYAVPFVTVAAARLMQSTSEPTAMLDRLYTSALDIGAPGRDQIYGYGQLRF